MSDRELPPRLPSLYLGGQSLRAGREAPACALAGRRGLPVDAGVGLCRIGAGGRWFPPRSGLGEPELGKTE